MSRLRNNLNELDKMLEDLRVNSYGVMESSRNLQGGDYTDYYSDLDYGESVSPSRNTAPNDRETMDQPGLIQSKKKRKGRTASSIGSGKSTLSIPSKPPHPPKLQHELKKTIFMTWSKPPRGITAYYEHQMSLEMNTTNEVDAGEAPRGDKSMIIHTDYGDLKSKYHYLGFGLWENTEPDEPPPPPRKLSPPPPPPKEEPIWYNCTVSVEEHQNPKEIEVPEEPIVFEAVEVEVYEPLPQEEPDMCEDIKKVFLDKLAMTDFNDDPERKLSYLLFLPSAHTWTHHHHCHGEKVPPQLFCV
ncbi:unnamed protein product [Lepeophtheirus salmonis]|uniref:(salmon louse) hypothetical protein n=1 Tax=Lepeophtheirus salmonis TaxID=72036 RepID=A0A7R8H516_LEPSM|nr:unnamed protein product [Lepeophtheirus salmonis]CAF2870175.1 unnamed protein product [Lepeophtheirus salmonis]